MLNKSIFIIYRSRLKSIVKRDSKHNYSRYKYNRKRKYSKCKLSS